MKKRIFALFLSALLLVTVLCACGDESQSEVGGTGSDGTSTSGEAVTGGELVVGISQDLGDSLDPYQMTAAGTREVLFNVYEGLVKPTSTGEYVPAVASDSTVSEDGLTYTFPLREGVLFHNGEEVTTDDVIYSFETCAETTVDTALAAALSAVESVTADGNTITVTLSEANPDFLSYVGMVYIVPDDYTDQATAPVGTGPFRFVSRSVQQNLVMEKFADYWGEGASLDKVTFQIFEDSNALMSALSAESVDMAVHLTIDQVNDLLDEMADSFPEELFDGLNGGINLLEEAKPDPEFPEGEMYILGEYCDDLLGQYINLYYGSFAALAEREDWGQETWEDELYTTLSHELTHHMEGRGGLHALDDRDAEELEEYRREYGGEM